MKKFDKDYILLEEMYDDDYFSSFLVDKIKHELQKIIDLLVLNFGLYRYRNCSLMKSESIFRRSGFEMTCRLVLY